MILVSIPAISSLFYVSSRPPTAYIHYLLVSPKWQGQGTGNALVQLTREKYKEFLYLTVVPEEQKNIAFYEKCGFTIVAGATPMFIFNPDLSSFAI